ncbi:metallophosphoesterase family protein [Shimazuella kribbensis]|uniref:metallophosphoesterase family protein n=1 Tax=Shimazuella kribbensis TaxID=139808 RepID=UPI00040926E5|nr:metallophosphoesterase family protein [Shimazuella kribbensis]
MHTIVVITDIHGNYPALEAVLREIDDKHPHIDHIYCLGDMIAIGPNTNEVLETLFSRENVSMILGNHEEAVMALIKKEQYPYIQEKSHHQWIADQLRPEFIPKLLQLPRTIMCEFENQNLLFTHFHIKPEKLNVPISENPYTSTSNQYPVPMNEVKKIFQDTTYVDAVLFGHLHESYHFQFNQTVFVSPEALGCNHQSFARYVLLEIEGESIRVSLKPISYDKEAFIRSFKQTNVPDQENILRIFYGEK